MTMVPPQTLNSKLHQLQFYCGGGYGGSYTGEEEYYYETAAGLLRGSDLKVVSAAHNPMAEDESRTITITTTTTATNTTSASHNNNDDGDEDDDTSWLQLSIGGLAKTNTTHADATTTPPLPPPPPPPPLPSREGGVGLVELDLLPPSRSEGERVISQENTRVQVVPQPLSRQVPPFLFQAEGAAGSGSSTFIPPPPPHFHHQHHQEINWAFRPNVLSIGTNSLSSSPTSSSSNHPLTTFMQLGSYFARSPFQFHGGGGVNVAGANLNFRVIDPPRRPHSGIWFSLQASQNQ